MLLNNRFMMLASQLLMFVLMLLTAVEGIAPKASFRSPKKIAFATLGGGSSHHIWVLELLEELHRRGHSVSFHSKGDQLRFAKDYPMVKTQEFGGHGSFVTHPLIRQFIGVIPEIADLAIAFAEVGNLNYTEEFNDLQGQLVDEGADLVICDSCAMSCIDSATNANIPVVITSTFAHYHDTAAPYINNSPYNALNPSTKDESLWTRITRDYIELPIRTWLLSRKLTKLRTSQISHGLSFSFDSSSPSLDRIPKIINNVFGIEAARKYSPLAHMIGPIMRKSFPDLDDQTKRFLDSHQRIVYIAFGQFTLLPEKSVHLILHSLIRLKEQGHIDGLIWANFKTSQLPTIKTSKRTYSPKDLANDADIYLTDWAPQFAILQHPSTSFFFTHGGAGSIHEALYSGVRLFVHPFFGDQPPNARMIEHVGLGRYLDTHDMTFDTDTYERLYKGLYQVAVDPGHVIQEAVDRYSAFIQISAEHAVQRGADLLEESLFATDDQGELYYRKDLGYEIHWFKRYNLDIYLVFATLGFIALRFVYNAFDASKTKSRLKKD